MGIAEGIIGGIGQFRRNDFSESGQSSRELLQRAAAEWRQRGENALRAFEEKVARGGLATEMERAVTRGELSDEVQQLVNAMRVVGGKDGEGLKKWLGQMGLSDRECEVMWQSVDAIGDREALVLALGDLSEVVGGKLDVLPGGSGLEKLVWQMAVTLRGRSEPEHDGSEWGGMASTSPASPGGAPRPPDKNKERPKKPKVAIPAPVPLGPRRQPHGTAARVVFAAGILACCAAATAIGLWGRGVAGSAPPEKEPVATEFAEVAGSKKGAEILVDYMFYDSSEVDEFPDTGHTAIEDFLRAYEIVDSPIKKRAYGESLLDGLRREGVLFEEGWPQTRITGHDKARLYGRLSDEGYSDGDITRLEIFIESYLLSR